MNPEGAPRILLVDDDDAHNRALGTHLERAGYLVSIAGDGAEALAILGKESFDLIITDLRMARMNGLDLLRSIQTMTPDVAVVVLIAHGEWTTYVTAMNIGALDYLNEPVQRQDILMTIRKALARRGIRAPYISSTQLDEVSGAAA